MVAVVEGRESCPSNWHDMTAAFAGLHAGGHPDISGATGTLDFDILHHAAVLYLTAANADEPSKADMLDPDMQIWLSNGFTRAFEQMVNRQPDVKMRDLYQFVARLTTGSHASIYNEAHYGNLSHNSIAEFLPDQVAVGIEEGRRMNVVVDGMTFKGDRSNSRRGEVSTSMTKGRSSLELTNDN